MIFFKLNSISSSSSTVERTFSEMSYGLEAEKSSQKASHAGMANQRAHLRSFRAALQKILKKENIEFVT